MDATWLCFRMILADVTRSNNGATYATGAAMAAATAIAATSAAASAATSAATSAAVEATAPADAEGESGVGVNGEATDGGDGDGEDGKSSGNEDGVVVSGGDAVGGEAGGGVRDARTEISSKDGERVGGAVAENRFEMIISHSLLVNKIKTRLVCAIADNHYHKETREGFLQ